MIALAKSFETAAALYYPNGRLLVAEPDPSTLYGRLYDVYMLMAHGTRLRSEAEMQELLEKSGFKLIRTVDTGSALRLFEGMPE